MTKWEIYEMEKRIIRNKAESAADYERAMAELIERLKL